MKNNNDFISEMKRISLKYGKCDIESCLKEIFYLKKLSEVDGEVFEMGRCEGHSDISASLRNILDPEDKNKWNIDGLLNEVKDNLNMIYAMKKELNKI